MRTIRHMTIDMCATAVALLALAGTIAATTASPIARADFGTATTATSYADGTNPRHMQVALQPMPSE